MTEYYLSKGDYARAKEFYSKAEQLELQAQWGPWVRALIAAQTGDKESALKIIKEIEATQNPRLWNTIAFIYYALGDLDSYFAYTNKTLDNQSFQWWNVMYNPLFAKARQDRRYAGLMDKIRSLNERSHRE